MRMSKEVKSIAQIECVSLKLISVCVWLAYICKTGRHTSIPIFNSYIKFTWDKLAFPFWKYCNFNEFIQLVYIVLGAFIVTLYTIVCKDIPEAVYCTCTKYVFGGLIHYIVTFCIIILRHVLRTQRFTSVYLSFGPYSNTYRNINI